MDMHMAAVGGGAPVRILPTGTEAISRRAEARLADDRLSADAAFVPDARQTDAAVSALNDSLKTLDLGLQFMVDKDSRRLVVKLVDQETGDVIRQYPSKELLSLARAMDGAKGGLLEAMA